MCPSAADSNGVNGHANGTNGDGNDYTKVSEQTHNQHRNPYQPVGDFLSNVSKFKIIESTLREGEQFANGKLSVSHF